MRTFHAANALETMMAPAADASLTPPAFHLKALLDVLEPRLHRAGFAEDVLGWKILIGNHDLLLGREKEFMRMHGDIRPTESSVKAVVEAFRDIARLREASTLVIYASDCGPWVTAFTKWSLGLPPKIRNGTGAVLFDQPGSPVTLQLLGHDWESRRSGYIRIEELSTTETLLSVFETKPADPRQAEELQLGGMISVRAHGEQEMEEATFKYHRPKIVRALPYALKLVRESLSYSSEVYLLRTRASTTLSKTSLRRTIYPYDIRPLFLTTTRLQGQHQYISLFLRLRAYGPSRRIRP